jgi:hypothetical protein
MNLGTLLPRHARYRPDHPAVVFDDQRAPATPLPAGRGRIGGALAHGRRLS